MINELKKDIILLSLISMSLTFTHCLMMFYSYLCSYYHWKNQEINFQNFYYINFTFTLGITIGSYISSFYFSLLGFKIGNILVNLLNLVVIYLFKNNERFLSILI